MHKVLTNDRNTPVYPIKMTMKFIKNSGSRTTGGQAKDTIMEEPLTPEQEQIAEIKMTGLRRRRSDAVSRPQLKRSNATPGEDQNRFLNKSWSEAVDPKAKVAQPEGLIPRKPVNASRPPTISNKPVNFSRPQTAERPKPQENVQRGWVNDWWVQRLRAGDVDDSRDRPALLTPTEALDTMLDESTKAPFIPKEVPEIWITEPEEVDLSATTCLFPVEEQDALESNASRAKSWLNGFLYSLPLTSSPAERPYSPKRSRFRHFHSVAAQEEPRPWSRHGLDQLPPVQILEEESKATLENGSFWSPQLAKGLDEVDASYSWGFEPLSRSKSHVPGAPIIRELTRSRALSDELREYEETDEEIDELDQDIETCSSRSVSPTLSDGSDTGFDMEEFENDPPTSDDSYFDPEPRLTWHENVVLQSSSSSLDTEPESMKRLQQVPAVQQWLQDQQQQQQKTPASSFSIPERVDETWAECYTPVSILESDPRYAGRDVVCNPRLAQRILLNRALCPKRRRSRSPRRSEIVVEAAERGFGLTGGSSLGKLYEEVVQEVEDEEESFWSSC